MEQVSLLVALTAGLLSFLSPCVLPLVPVYVAALCGPGILDTSVSRRRFPILHHFLSFVTGFALVFTLLGAGLAGFIISSHIGLVRQIAGVLLIAFGLFILAALKIPWLNYERRLAPSQRLATSSLRSFLTGAILTLAWTPCASPIPGSILTLALSSGTAGYGAYLLAIYSLGLGVPFLVIGAAFDFITPLLKHIYCYSTAIYIFSGILLITVGILILTNNLVWFQR